ncbi:hypothetical protein D3C81_1997690 [compost metagenome]
MPQLTDQIDATSRQTDRIDRTFHHSLDVKSLAAVLDAYYQTPTLALRRNLQMDSHVTVLQFIQARITLLVVTGKTGDIALEV